MLNAEEIEAMNEDFDQRLQGMLELVARGRGIEILIRISDQTRKGLAVARESYKSMMNSELKIPNLHPPQSLPRLFADNAERERLEVARKIADKLAHALYRQARELIDKYRKNYGLETEVTSDGVPGSCIYAEGHLIEEDGRHIESITDTLVSSDENLVVEEYDVFVHNKYDIAAFEIFDDARNRIAEGQRSLAIDVALLRRFRGFGRGKREYYQGQSATTNPAR